MKIERDRVAIDEQTYRRVMGANDSLEKALAEGRLFECHYDILAGIDAGSTTIKSVVLDAEGTIVFSTYGSNEGDPVAAYQAAARSAWAQDAAKIQHLAQEEFATASAVLASRAKERLAKTLAEAPGNQKGAATVEIEQRTALAEAISACMDYLREPSV